MGKKASGWLPRDSRMWICNECDDGARWTACALEMMEAIRNQGSECKFIVLSGYADFKFANNSAGGAWIIFLKPVTKDIEERVVLERVEQKIRKKIPNEPSTFPEQELWKRLASVPERKHGWKLSEGAGIQDGEQGRYTCWCLRRMPVYSFRRNKSGKSWILSVRRAAFHFSRRQA